MSDAGGSNDVQMVKDRIDIATVVGQQISLTEKGARLWGLCPFHSERTPSFTVNPELGQYYCFGCKAHGDVFDFVMSTQGIGFRDALESLADTAGVELSGPVPGQAGQVAAARLVMAEAVDYYHQALMGPEGQSARQWLKSRGIDKETAIKWQLGFSAVPALATTDIDRELAKKLGLTSDLGRDRLSGRVCIPICDASGRPIAISGRYLGTVPPGTPKYLATSSSVIWDKSRTLFGYHLAGPEIRSRRSAIVVEGEIDTIAMHQAGYSNTCAPCGSGFGRHHAQQLALATPRIVVMSDGDEAGYKMAMHAWNQAVGLNTRVDMAILPAGWDPDDMVRRNPEAIDALLELAVSPVQQRLSAIQSDIESAQDDPERQAGLIRHGADFISEIGDPVVKARTAQMWEGRWGLTVDIQTKRRNQRGTTADYNSPQYLALALAVQRPEEMARLIPQLLEDDVSRAALAMIRAGTTTDDDALGAVMAWAACVDVSDIDIGHCLWSLAAAYARGLVDQALIGHDHQRAADIAKLLAIGPSGLDRLLSLLAYDL